MAAANTDLRWIALALLPGLWALWGRTLLPLDETRYLTVAWEMWQRQDWLVPFLNGQAYSHKPPLLFWLINAGWWLFGVNEWWPRLIAPALAVVDGWLAARLAGALWPTRPEVRQRVPWLVASSLGIIAFAQLVFFDLLLLAFVLGALLLIVQRAGNWRHRDTLGLGLLLAGGVLAKGPMVFLQVLLPAVFAPLALPGVRRRARRLALPWLGQLLAAGLAGLLLAGLWAIPAALHGGPDYAAAILWGQTANRMVNSFAHARPWWFYLLALPAMALPWSLAWPGLARSARGTQPDAGVRLALGWLVSVGVALSMLSGKQPHYALPLVVPLALLVARHLSAGAAARVPSMAAGTVGAVLVAATGFFVWTDAGAGFDLRAPAGAVHRLQASGAEIAVVGGYHGQFGFLGRLQRPLDQIDATRVGDWARTHAGGYLVTFKNALPSTVPATRVADFPYRRQRLYIYRSTAAGQLGDRGASHDDKEQNP
jgi:4-amino-4-deoxy-L-arabinose transferase-like glycosyltransferase